MDKLAPILVLLVFFIPPFCEAKKLDGTFKNCRDPDRGSICWEERSRG